MKHQPSPGRCLSAIAALCLLATCKKGPLSSTPQAQRVAPSVAEVTAAPAQFESRDPLVRLEALHVLITSGSRQATLPLLRVLERGNAREKRLAALGLGLLADERALAPLMAVAQHATDELLLTEVAWALGRFPAERVRAPLLDLLRRQSSEGGGSDRMKQAAESLAALGDAEAMEPVLNHWGDLPPLLGPIAPSTFEHLDGPDPRLAEALVVRPQCDAVELILRWSHLPPPQGAPGFAVDADTLLGIPEGCAAELRRNIERNGGSDAGLLEAFATPADVELLRKLSSKPESRLAAAAALNHWGAPLGVDVLPGEASFLANPLDPAWPNRIWHELLKPGRHDSWNDDAVRTRGFQSVLRQLKGSGEITAQYDLKPDLAVDQLTKLAASMSSSKLQHGDGALVALLGISNPNGLQAVERVLQGIDSREEARLWWLDATLAESFLERSTSELVKLSHSAARVMKTAAMRNLAWRQDPEARARIQEAIVEPDAVAQKAVALANSRLLIGPVSVLAPLLASSDPSVVNVVLDAALKHGTPSDAAALNLAVHEAGFAARYDMISLLAAVEPERAERRLRDALSGSDAESRERAVRWLELEERHWPSAARLESRLILNAISGSNEGPTRDALLAAAPHLLAEDVWEVLHRSENDAERRGFLAALTRPEEELQHATGQALAAVVGHYAPDATTRGLVVAHASRLIGLVKHDETGADFSGAARQQAFARGLVIWLGNEPNLAPGFAQALMRCNRPEELAALLKLQPTRVVVDAMLDLLPQLSEPGNLREVIARLTSTTHLPTLVARLSQRSSPLRPLSSRLLDDTWLSDEAVRDSALREPVRALLAEQQVADDEVTPALHQFALQVAMRSKDAFYLPLLNELAARTPPNQATSLDRALALIAGKASYGRLLRDDGGDTDYLSAVAAPVASDSSLPVSLALGATLGHGVDPAHLADLLISRHEPELLALLPRLEHAPGGTAAWFKVAGARNIALPPGPALTALSSAAALYLARRHDTQHWPGVLSVLCEFESAPNVALDTEAYSVDELAQGLGAEHAIARVCALRVLARRSPADLVQRLLAASRDASPLVRQAAMQLAIEHPQPELAARALALLEAGDTPALRPWLLAVWLQSAPAEIAERLLALGPLLRGSIELPRISAGDFDECSYWLPLAAVHQRTAEAEYLSFVFDRGNPGPSAACDLKIWLPLAWSGADFVAHYDGASRVDQDLLLDKLLDAQLPQSASYAVALERVAPDVLRFDAPGHAGLHKLLERLLDLPTPIAKRLFQKLFQGQPLDPTSRKLVAEVQARL